MFTFLKKFIKTGVIALLLVGGAAFVAVAVAGPERAHAVISQAQDHVLQSIDGHINDPAALRQQLQEMEKEYPSRISQVRSDLAELNEEIRQIQRERAISERVVELAQMDLENLQVELTSASASGNTRLSASSSARSTSMSPAARRARQIESTRLVYANRAEEAATELMYLGQQSARFEEHLAQLETEHAQFTGQLQALNRQVESIARNERLIKLVEKHNRRFQDCNRYEAVSLDQITGRLNEIRTRQEAEIDTLTNGQGQGDYEDMARLQLAEEAFEARNSGDNILEARPLTSER